MRNLITILNLPWSNTEVELIVSDYFDMLSFELKGKNYSKAEHRRNILPLLNNRSEGSVEFKHQNISAILVNLGQPFIKGYLPRFNYQMILEDTVLDYLIHNIGIEKQFEHFAQKSINISNRKVDFEEFITEAPKIKLIEEPQPTYKKKNPLKDNYLEKEQKNRSIGIQGEELVISYEKWYLMRIGKENLADKIEWISKDIGDGAGFDILSRNPNGSDKYIEVKSTKLSRETPFFYTRNELEFSIDHSKQFYLYRIFNIEDNARMFIKNGDLKSICRSIPISYKGYF